MTRPQDVPMSPPATPARRTNRLAVQKIESETLLYDEDLHRAYLLNPVAAAVWHACDGHSTPAQIAVAVTLQMQQPVSEDIVHCALTGLRRDGLLAADNNLLLLPVLERRELLRRLGTAALILLPAIAMVATPTAAQAYSGNTSS